MFDLNCEALTTPSRDLWSKHVFISSKDDDSQSQTSTNIESRYISNVLYFLLHDHVNNEENQCDDYNVHDLFNFDNKQQRD